MKRTSSCMDSETNQPNKKVKHDAQSPTKHLPEICIKIYDVHQDLPVSVQLSETHKIQLSISQLDSILGYVVNNHHDRSGLIKLLGQFEAQLPNGCWNNISRYIVDCHQDCFSLIKLFMQFTAHPSNDCWNNILGCIVNSHQDRSGLIKLFRQFETQLPNDCWNNILEYAIDSYQDFFDLRQISSGIRNQPFYTKTNSLFTNIKNGNVLFVEQGITRTYEHNKSLTTGETRYSIIENSYRELDINTKCELKFNCILFNHSEKFVISGVDGITLATTHHDGPIEHLYISGFDLPKSTTSAKKQPISENKWAVAFSYPSAKHLYIADCKNTKTIIGRPGFFKQAANLRSLTFIQPEFESTEIKPLVQSISENENVKNIHIVGLNYLSPMVRTLKKPIHIQTFHNFKKRIKKQKD
jgi:hypothetical protein